MTKEERKRYDALKRRERVKKQRDKIIELLGAICKCGYTDNRALNIDHINGGGTKERKKVGGGYYTFVLKQLNAGSKDYQLLCCNCNQIKKVVNDEERHRVHV